LYQVVGYKELDLRHKKSKDEITSYFDQGSVTQRTDYYYDYNFNDEYDQLEYQVTTDGNGDSLKIYFEYPYDHLGEATYAAMNTANQIANPVKILKLKNNDSISKQQIDFVSAGGQYLPNVIEMAKGTNSLEPRINYDYDNQGNIIKVSKFSGVASGSPSSTGNIKTLYIWGYNKMYPIAKLENMGTDNISGSTISSLHLLSALDNDRTYGVAGKEGDLRNALNNLRVLFPEALITTYTYDPMIGVTSITDPMGNTVYYEYDAQNRLIEVKDLDNKLISDYQYHLKVQN
jgi:YD repeat-containing protein